MIRTSFFPAEWDLLYRVRKAGLKCENKRRVQMYVELEMHQEKGGEIRFGGTKIKESVLTKQ